MSLFEWFCERKKLGPMGTVGLGSKKLAQRSNGLILLRFIIAISLIGYFYYIIASSFLGGTLSVYVMITVFLTFYCIVAYFIRPEPDLSNMGWAGGLINNPFKITDNWNRKLMLFKILLMPGVFITGSIV